MALAKGPGVDQIFPMKFLAGFIVGAACVWVWFWLNPPEPVTIERNSSASAKIESGNGDSVKTAAVAPSSTPLPWNIPRKIVGTSGRVYPYVTIVRVWNDGGVTVNLGPNAIKIPGGEIDGPTMKAILAAAPWGAIPTPTPKATPTKPAL